MIEVGVKKNVFSIQKGIEKFDLLALMAVEKLIFPPYAKIPSSIVPCKKIRVVCNLVIMIF